MGCGSTCQMQDQEYQIECPSCSGYGCQECVGGQLSLKGCPQNECKGIVPTIEMIDLFHEGLPPVSGGMLDQSVSFIEAARFLKNIESKIERQR